MARVVRHEIIARPIESLFLLRNDSEFYKTARGRVRLARQPHESLQVGENDSSWPIDASDESNSNCANVRKLGAGLLLVTGEVDNIVDPAMTMRSVGALIKANKNIPT